MKLIYLAASLVAVAMLSIAGVASAQDLGFGVKTEKFGSAIKTTVTFDDSAARATNTYSTAIQTCPMMSMTFFEAGTVDIDLYAVDPDENTFTEITAGSPLTSFTGSTSEPYIINTGKQKLRFVVVDDESSTTDASTAILWCITQESKRDIEDKAYAIIDDQLLLGTGAGTADYVTLTDCNGSGESMTYDTATNAFACKTHIETEAFIFETAVTADDPLVKATAEITLASLDCTATGGTTPSAQIVEVFECTNAGATCVGSGYTITAAALTTNYNDATGTDSTIDDGDYWGVHTVSLTTAADLLHCTVEFTQ